MKHEVRLLFHELLELSAAERERVFRERRIAADLRAEIESLLSFDSAKSDDLTNVVSTVAGEVLSTASSLEVNYCGPYRTIRVLGSGGMGVVYLAERTDGEIQQKVAVKLLRTDGHRRAWRGRFLRERQLLASLQHPSIVHVIDAGHTEDGRPFLVMEYVEGVTIDVYAAGIDVDARLELFLKVCEGVSHAHRRLIIHRDLKPSNILVDASGQPKLLDFGIARLLDETGDLTQTIERLLTPNYASPEQLQGTAQTTATDIYSLGAVLYKLLAGVGPREHATGTPNPEITALSRVNPDVPKDVDFIVRKALRAEPEERYLSVDEFANDVRATLERRPVKARAGDVWYRARKFLWRYWVPVVAAILVMASLSAGLYVANRERAIAERRFVEVRQLASKLFDIDVEVARLPGSTKVRQLIVDTSLEYLQRLTADVRLDSDLAVEVGTAYMRVARAQRMGPSDQADQTEQKAQALIDSVLVSEPANRTALLRAAQIAQDRMLIARHTHPDDALQFAEKSAQRLQEYLSTGTKNQKWDRVEAEQVILSSLNIANQFVRAERFDEVIRISQRTIDLASATNWPAYAGGALLNLAEAYRANGELEEALPAIRESVRILEPPADSRTPGRLLAYISALIIEGQILGEDNKISLGRADEAMELLQRAFEMAADLARRDANDFMSRERTFSAEVSLADILRHTDPRRALERYNHALQGLTEVNGKEGARLNEIEILANSTYALRQLGNNVEARKRLDLAFERLKELKLYPARQIKLGSEVDDAVRALADYEAGVGNFQRGAQLYRELLELVLAANPKPETSLADAVALSNIYKSAAPLHDRAGQPEQGSKLETLRRELWQRWNNKVPNNAFVRRQLDAARIP